MKRVLLALGLLLFIGVLCGLSLYDQMHNVRALIEMTEELKIPFSEEDVPVSLEQTYAFVKEFKKRTRFFPFYMRHSEITKIEETVVVLPVYLETNELEHFQAELMKCRNQLENLYQQEVPLLGNIL